MAEEYWKDSPFGKDSIFAPSWDEKQKEEREKREAKVQQNKVDDNKQTSGVFYQSDGTWLGNVGSNKLPVYVVGDSLLKEKKSIENIKQNLVQINRAVSNSAVQAKDKKKGEEDLEWYIKKCINLHIQYGVLTSNAMLTIISYAESHRDERESYEQKNSKKKDGTFHNINDKEVGSPFGAYQLTKSTFRLYRKAEGKITEEDMITSPANQDAVASYILKTVSKGKVYALLNSSDISDHKTQATTLQKVYDLLGANTAPIDKKTGKRKGDNSTWPSLPGQSQNNGIYALKADRAQQIFNDEIVRQIMSLCTTYSKKK